MATHSPPSSYGNYVPEDLIFPEDQKDMLFMLQRILEEHARHINRKDTGSYEEIETLTNQQYFGLTPHEKRYVFRKVFNFNSIASGATLNIPHGIANVVEYTNIYGTCITNVVDYRPLPYVSVIAVNQGIELTVTGVNIVIVNGAAAAPITKGIVILEFTKN